MIAIVFVVGVVIGFASVLAGKFLSTYTALGTTLLMVLVATVFALPLFYTYIRYILTDGTGFWRTIASHYALGCADGDSSSS